jgi:hypothetical protein
VREHFVVSSICRHEVARAQWSFVRHREEALKALDFGNSLLGVHSVPISNMSMAIVKWNADHWAELVRLAHIPPAVHGNSLTRHVVIHGKHDGDSGNIID